MYFITTIRYERDAENGNIIIHDKRTVGFFRRFEEAHEKVIYNVADIFECGYYQYAVISRMGQGLYKFCKEIQWYSSHRDDIKGVVDRVNIITRPEQLRNFHLYVIS